MGRAVAVLASLGDRIATVLPTDNSEAPFEAIAADGFVLERQGLDAESFELADRLAQAHPRVGLAEVLDHANRQARPFAHALGGRAGGYRWDRQDDGTRAWYPQGITGSADAEAEGLVAGREVHVASWYSKPGQGTRLSFVDVAARRYRHVLCVRPTGDDGFAPVKVHAGGILWVGSLIYVADTRHGLRVFDTDRILRVPEARSGGAQGYAYMLPQVGAYRSTGAKLSFSFASLGRESPAALTAGEYAKAPGGRVVRWAIDLSTGLVPDGRATEAFRAPFDRLQGAATVSGSLLASSSRRGGRLYVARSGDRSTGHVWWPFLPEDLYVSGPTRKVHSLTEEPGMRMVFGVPYSVLGL